MKTIRSEADRQLMLRIVDGCAGVTPIVFMLYKQMRRAPEMFKWLIAERITGRIFLAWFNGPMEGSPLNAETYILRRLTKDKDLKVLAGRDYLVD
jgi:hypothetical protein